EVEDLFVVGCELRAGFEAGGRSKLPRDRRLTRQFVQRVDIEVLLPLGARRHQGPFAVGADHLRSGVNPHGQEAQPLADVFKDDLDWFLFVLRHVVFCLVWRGMWPLALRFGRPWSRLLALRSVSLVLEEIADLTFAEFRGRRDQVDAAQAAVLGALIRVEQDVFAVGTPRDRAAESVCEEAGLPAFAARRRNHADVG